jgi:general secretion pathway protein A
VTTSTSTIYEHMFRSFGLRENPFHVSPDPRFLFSGPAYETAVAELMFGIESHRGLLVLTGEAGTGKTTLIRQFLQWLKDRQFSSSYIFHSHLQSSEMLELIVHDFGVAVDSSRKTDLLATLHRWLHSRQSEGDSPVIVIDEAQALSLRTLSELNLLLNLEDTHGKLVQIVLAGQPELEEKLRRPELRALRQRIMVRCRLPLLSLEETSEYIAARLRGAGGNGTQTFPPETVQTVYGYARGIPRVINLLCEQALIGAYADRHTTVSPGNVRRVASEFDLVGAPISTSGFDLFFEPWRQAPLAPVSEAPDIKIEETHAVTEPLPGREAFAVADIAASPESPRVGETPAAMEPISLAEDTSVEMRAFAATASVPTPSNGPRVQPPPTEAAPKAAVADPVAPLALAREATAETLLPGPPLSSTPAKTMLESKPLAPPRAPIRDLQSSRKHEWRKRSPASTFHLYWRDVAESFVRDWSRFFASLAPHANAFAGSAPRHSFRRKVIEPLGNWLRTPVNSKKRSARSAMPPVHSGKT